METLLASPKATVDLKSPTSDWFRFLNDRLRCRTPNRNLGCYYDRLALEFDSSNGLVGMPFDQRHLYIKLRKHEPSGWEPAHYHIHVDAHGQLEPRTVRQLLDAGFFYDYFDHDHSVYGLDGDPTVPFPSYAPNVHFTFVTPSVTEYKKLWGISLEILKRSTTPCYLEGEFVLLDEPIPPGPFSLRAYEGLVAPRSSADETPFRYLSAIEGLWRSLPAVVRLRRLDPIRKGPRDQFRRAEVHLTLADDTEPRLLELLCNLRFSVPAIPKLVEGADGTLEKIETGVLKVIHDIPLTLQATNMQQIVLITNLALHIIKQVGGLRDGSIKLEQAIHFSLLNGIDHCKDLPPVIDTISLREDIPPFSDMRVTPFADIHILAKSAGMRAQVAQHVDKRILFDEVWQRTGSALRDQS